MWRGTRGAQPQSWPYLSARRRAEPAIPLAPAGWREQFRTLKPVFVSCGEHLPVSRGSHRPHTGLTVLVNARSDDHEGSGRTIGARPGISHTRRVGGPGTAIVRPRKIHSASQPLTWAASGVRHGRARPAPVSATLRQGRAVTWAGVRCRRKPAGRKRFKRQRGKSSGNETAGPGLAGLPRNRVCPRRIRLDPLHGRTACSTRSTPVARHGGGPAPHPHPGDLGATA
jgi:hypothetical protein